jgi:hypothetical protein
MPGAVPTIPGELRQVKEQKGNSMRDAARRRLSKVDNPDSAATSGGRRQQVASEGGQMAKLTGIALKRAQLVPSAMFASPAAVVRSRALSLSQKIAILRRWEFDARQRSGARQALAVGIEAGLLEEVHAALADLGAPADPSEIRRPSLPVAAH